MKNAVKFLCVLLTSIMVLSVVGCVGKEDIKYKSETAGVDYSDGVMNRPTDPVSGEKGEINDSMVAPSDGTPVTGDMSDIRVEVGGIPVLGENGEIIGVEPTVAPKDDFVSTQVQNVSTFSADVDTASYTYFRKLVNSGYNLNSLINSGSAFRAEEFINYFDYSAKAPSEEEIFGVTSNIISCPWNSESLLLTLTLQAEQADDCKGNNLVFLIDVSGSMGSRDKLPLLQQTFRYLVDNLDENDRVSIVTYSGRESVILNGCEGNKGEMIIGAINGLVASGSTNGEAGLTKAYTIAEENYIEGGNNRIIMASDGDLNVGISSAKELEQYVSNKRNQGIYLSVLGFGTGNYRDDNMEALADNGNGAYYYIDGASEAERIFGTNLLGTLYTVAEDVKLQVTFDKELVSAYRLIGYKNRMLNEEDFDNDRKDAGEVGSGHQVTVCYEIKLCEDVEISEEALLDLAVRYKNPGEPISMLNSYKIGGASYNELVNDDITFMTCVIETCMILEGNKDMSIDGVLETLNALDLSSYPEREEFRELISALAK